MAKDNFDVQNGKDMSKKNGICCKPGEGRKKIQKIGLDKALNGDCLKQIDVEKNMREGKFDQVFGEVCRKIRGKFNLRKGDYNYHICLEYPNKDGNTRRRNLFLREKIIIIIDENGFKYQLNMYTNHLRIFKNSYIGQCIHEEPVSLHEVLLQFNAFLDQPNGKYEVKKG